MHIVKLLNQAFSLERVQLSRQSSMLGREGVEGLKPAHRGKNNWLMDQDFCVKITLVDWCYNIQEVLVRPLILFCNGAAQSKLQCQPWRLCAWYDFFALHHSQ